MERTAFQVLTAAGAVLSDGVPVCIHGISISGVGDVLIRNGTVGGDIVIDINGDGGNMKTHLWSIPIAFPNGAYVSSVGDGNRCTIFYTKL